ncbi:MAG TPA: 4-(cytidine 5'-diphospho)-2-C-methyl-D-erythritol kinase [Povalibacter sp.]|uniref:4-(cytidine 5'-diphospho)-2-C-methyl-D-erythritol kinase n=1 Tax=Povalibacter sp. TaxID=1962978 RepID=UPI002BECB698|nr:4-(cytidine 5'-diphospho)-2-C-methyl-D-erythritol kinase [Povalibacter sp.]HMN46406.1 4-(cytidine 5'-diphospho)-2-C-methyl-D-erythritol kinase [Povalibacter sp.]
MNDGTRGESLGDAAPWPAPAKLNLCLHIVGRRADGYHLLQTAMQFIDLADELRFFIRPNGVVERLGGMAEVPAESDLVVRAARLLASHVNPQPGVAIDLHKRIPAQAGLGGGSSDAATTLVALNHLWNAGLNLDELAALGLKLGADVPLFVRGHAAWAEGVGEHLTPIEPPENVYLVIKPQAAVSTAEIFQAAELTRNSPVTTIRAFLAGGGRNDCTSTVRGRYPEIAEALDWLEEFGHAQLTGTGSCVFAAIASESAASAALRRVPTRWSGYVVRGLNRSPLLERLGRESDEVIG